MDELQSSPHHFVDVTVESMKDTAALDSLIWTQLMERELSLVLPTVKCPAGCSEYKHRCNELPLDVILQELLGTALPLLMTTAKNASACTRMIRKDYLFPDMIASNPHWLCRPSIAKTKRGAPVVLCCRHHSVTSKHQYVHPPRNPTGCLSSTVSGGLSPVVAIPRTIKKAKLNSCSASFHMAQLEGSFAGLDSMYLSANSNVNSTNSPLGWRQDVFTYANRYDVRAYITKKYKDSPGEGTTSRALARNAEKLYPYLPEMRSRFLSSATYVSLSAAINMQKHVDFGSPETGVKRTGEDQIESTTQFVGHYPKTIVYAHPAVSRIGCRPPQPPAYQNRGFDTRAAWYLSSMMLLIPEIWQAVAAVENKKSWEWEGNLLTYLTVNCLPHIKPNSTRNGPFSCKVSKQKLLSKFFADFTGRSHTTLLSSFIDNEQLLPTIYVHNNTIPLQIPDGKEVLVVIRENLVDNAGQVAWIPRETMTMHSKSWRLCYIGQSNNSTQQNHNSWDATVFCRHSNDQFCDWWKVTRAGRMPMNHTSNAIHAEIQNWEVAIYVLVDPLITAEMRDSIMSSCGGQSKVYCEQHNYPLICAEHGTSRICCCSNDNIGNIGQPLEQPITRCTKKAMYCCPVSSCRNSICKNHQVRVVDWQGKYYVGDRCGYGEPRPINDVFNEDDNNNITHVESFLEGGQVMPNFEEEYDNDDDDQRIEAHFRLMENIDDGIFLTETRTGFDDDVNFTDPDNLGQPESVADPGDLVIPTTDAGTLPIYTFVDEYCDYSNATVNNHVLLNNFGHMLIRRNQRLTGTINQRNFLQKLVAKSPGGSLPLVYPEGMLFSDMFPWSTMQGDVYGAIPSAFLNTDRVLSGFGFASLEDHYRTRISNPGIFASTDPKYHLFAFDCLANLGLRGCDSRVILRRGFAEMQGEAAGVRFKDAKEERIMDTEQVDSSSVVNKLAAAVHERPPTYFYTHTCSMLTHFGMKLIWDWLTGESILKTFLDGTENDEQIEELRHNIIDGNGVLLLRSWMEMVHIWINYITHSPEQPIGEVDQFLFRLELQDATANLPHIHALLWTRDNLQSEEGLKRVLDRIRGFILDILRPDEREHYIRTGVFEDNEAVARFLSMAETFLSHHHTRRCFVARPSQNEDGEDEVTMKCKANDNWKDNPSPSEHSFVSIPVKHSEDAITIMVELGLGESHHGIFHPIADCLKAVKHYPPAHGNEGLVSPVFAGLMPINPNMCNVQFATGYTLSRYLAKYLVSIDLYNTIRITPPKPPPQDQNTYHVYGEELPNQKITGNRLQQEKRIRDEEKQTGRLRNKREGRAFNVTEFYMMLFGYSPILTNIPFYNITTKPYDERIGRDRMKPIERLEVQPSLQHEALTPVNTIPSHTTRLDLNLPRWRQFLDTQVQVIFDDMQSPVSTNPITAFGGRPPELMFVARHQDYRRWFIEKKYKGKFEALTKDIKEWIGVSLHQSRWIDGFNSRIYVREAAVHSIIECLDQRNCHWFDGYDEMHDLFRNLEQAILQRRTDPSHLSEEDRELLVRFVSTDTTRMPVIWFQSTRPTRNIHFLVHLLLTLGHIKDEYDLFGCHDLRESFIRANLLDPNDPQSSVTKLMREYITQQLARLPSGTNTFDRYLVAAFHTVSKLFMENTIHNEDIPGALYCRLRRATGESIDRYEQTRTRSLVQQLHFKLSECGFDNLPTEEQCLQATFNVPVPWDITTLPHGRDQPMESYDEQNEVLSLATRLVQHYKTAPSNYTKGICHVGAGGVGKTTVLFIQLYYCMCQGLNTGITALLSERAQELAGLHIHDLFCFQARNDMTPGQLAERACGMLFRNPEKLEYLRTLDVLALDEAGAIPCEILAAMCYVLRYIRDSNLPFGGLLLLATLDYLQLDPVSGSHILLSPIFTSCFYFREFKHSVRSALDNAFKRLQTITRMTYNQLLAPGIREEFIRLFISTFSFVTSITDASLPQNLLFVFGKKEPIRIQERQLQKRIEANHIQYRISTAIDEEKTIDGSSFRAASEMTSKNLDKLVKEPRRLVLFVGGRYQITTNKPGKYSNSQLAILFDLPTQEELNKKTEIMLVVAPPGCRFIPDASVTKQQLLDQGWKQEKIGATHRNSVHNTSGSTRSKRTQYALRPHVGSTIHGAMGQTLESLLTRVERGGKSHPYALWLKAQVVVLLSRTRLGRNTYFWLPRGTTPTETAEAIYDLLCRTSPFRDYLCHLLEQLCARNITEHSQYAIDQSKSIWRPCDVAVPTDNLGFVYMLVSTKNPSYVYIGSTKNIVKRLQQHNTGYGAEQTKAIRLRPWALLAYIAGFDGDERRYKDVENMWIAQKVELIADPRIQSSVQAIQNIGKDIVAMNNRLDDTSLLRFVSCGTVERAGTERNHM